MVKSNQHNEKILIVAPSWVGDMVMAQALLRLIKRKIPNCIIDVLASPMLHPLLRRMPEVNDCLVSPFHHGDLKLMARFKIAQNLRKNFYTKAYVLPNSFKSALIPFWAKIPRRIGWLGEARFILLNEPRFLVKKKLSLMVERFVALADAKSEPLLEATLLPRLQISVEQLDFAMQRLQLSLPSRPILALCPGAEYGPAKRWPASYFGELAKAKIEEGWEVWLFGSTKDKKMSQEIQEHCGGVCIDLIGKTDLGEAIDLLSLATVVVTNDSGLMHIAAALSKPLIAIYGSTSPKFVSPLSNNKFRTLVSNLPCSPCCERECPLQHTKCLYDIKPEVVLKAIAAIA